MSAEASARGKRNRRKGHDTEREVVKWLRSAGWPDACTTRAKLGHDGFSAPGDVDFHPLVCLEVKNVSSGSAWPTWCRQTVRETRAGLVPAVVRKTAGVRDVSRWEVRVRQYEWLTILDGHPGYPLVEVDQDGETWVWAVMTMDDLANAVAAVDNRDDES